jgi:alpha-tubulin suppressor-like RCC1 family protein
LSNTIPFDIRSWGIQQSGEFGTGEVKTATAVTVQRNEKNIYTHATPTALLADNGIMYLFDARKLVAAKVDVLFKSIISYETQEDHYGLSMAGKLVNINLYATRNVVMKDLNDTIDTTMVITDLWANYFITEENQIYRAFHEHGTVRFQPRFTKNYFANSIVKIVSGFTHDVALLANGTVMVWGSNSASQLGCDASLYSTQVPITYELLKGFRETKFIDVSAAGEMTVAVSDTGVVYHSGKLTQTSVIKKRYVIQDVYITKAYAGSDYITMLSSAGVLYSVGKNTKGQLADGTTTDRIEPIVSKQLSAQKVLQYAVYEDMLLCVYEEKYTQWNSNLFPISNENIWNEMSTANIGTERVMKIASQSTQTLMLTQNGTLYAMGSNSWGGLGDGSVMDSNVPLKVNMDGSLAGKKVTAIHVGYLGETNLAITEDGKFYVWGKQVLCSDYNFGTHSPYRIDLPENTTATHIASLEYDWAVLLSNGCIYSCGSQPVTDLLFTKMFPFPDNLGFGGITRDNKLVVVSKDFRTPHMLKIAESTNGTSIIAVILKPPPFDVSRVTRFTMWHSDNTLVITVILDSGETYTGNDQWTKSEPVDPLVSTESVLVYPNGTMHIHWTASYARQTSTIQIPKESIRKITGVARTATGVVGIFAKCSPHFVGEKCDIPVCYTFDANDYRVCSGQGRCERPQTCVCNQYYKGNTCSQYSEHTIVLIATLTVVFGVLLVVLIITILLVSTGYAIKYRTRVAKQYQTERAIKSLLHESLIKADALSAQVDRDWVIPFSELKFVEKLSEGSFGVVMKGRYQSADVYVVTIIFSPNSAIKIIKNFNPEDMAFEHEVKMLRSLRHPNILLFMGVAVTVCLLARY